MGPSKVTQKAPNRDAAHILGDTVGRPVTGEPHANMIKTPGHRNLKIQRSAEDAEAPEGLRQIQGKEQLQDPALLALLQTLPTDMQQWAMEIKSDTAIHRFTYATVNVKLN